jgi:NF-kappa-B inhibitor-like protein 2
MQSFLCYMYLFFYRETPLHTVCRLGNIDCVRSLLSCGADVNARNAFRYTPLHVACYHGHTDIVEVLLQSGGVF